MKKSSNVISKYNKYVLNTYTRTPSVFVKAKDSWIYDIEGKKYLDFFPGWAVSGLGHCNSTVVKAIKDQSDKILHVSNNYYSKPQAELAERLCKLSFPGKVFFANSGAEANEAAIKLARAYGNAQGRINSAQVRYEIITMKKSFHGRTMATIAATGQDKVKKGFKPLLAGFKHIDYNDIDLLKKTINKKTIAVMLELIQGEGGINIAGYDYVRKIRKICTDMDILMIVDEVQTGIGRTGKMFCYQHYGIKPDLMTLAKSLGGGMPIGAMVVSEKFSDVLKPGMHASTFGGSPIVCSAAIGVLDAIKKNKLIANANKMSDYFYKKLNLLKIKYPDIINNIKIKGLMIGLELKTASDQIAKECFKRALIINSTQGNILRILPAITVNKTHINKAIKILDSVLKEL